MAFRMSRHLNVSAAEALALLASIDGPWNVPEREHFSRASRVYRTRVTTRGNEFTMTVEAMSRDQFAEVHGAVTPTGLGTSTLTARVGTPPMWRYVVKGAVFFGVILIVSDFEAWALVILPAFVLLSVLSSRFTDSGITYEGDPVARALADMIDAKLAPHLVADASQIAGLPHG